MVNARSERPLCCPPHMPQEIGDVCFGSGLGPSSKRANEVGAAPGSSTFGPQPRTRCLPHPSLQTRPTPPVHWEGGPSVRPGSASCAPRLLSCPPGAHRAAAGRLPQLRPSLHSQQVRSEAWLFILCLHALLGRPSRRPVRSSPDHVEHPSCCPSVLKVSTDHFQAFYPQASRQLATRKSAALKFESQG